MCDQEVLPQLDHQGLGARLSQMELALHVRRIPAAKSPRLGLPLHDHQSLDDLSRRKEQQQLSRLILGAMSSLLEFLRLGHLNLDGRLHQDELELHDRQNPDEKSSRRGF